nr:RNA-directed DNA polymerase, eukaryota [Tanacetum cinerariifolium]
MKSGRSIKDEFNIMHKGKKYWIRVNETPGWIPDFTDDLDDEDQEDIESNPEDIDNQESENCDNCLNDSGLDNDSDMEEVPETCFEDGKSMNSKDDGDNYPPKTELSEDPFKIYPLLNKHKSEDGSINKMGDSLKFLPGFTPMDEKDKISNNKGEKHFHNNECGNESMASGHFKQSECPRTGGSILSLLEEVVKVGQVMGYRMEGCMANMGEIIVGSSGDILCIWDPNSFNKHSVTMSDYFVIIRGTWRTSSQKVLIIAVYGPHDCRDKQSLWEFLHQEISKWRGEVIIMGDFNEVCFTSDRFGSNFNEHGAYMFNSFIADSGLVEVPLGGCHFTWCLKSAKKMSKLDRFLVSENLLVSCPHLTAVTLERYLSDYHPILLRENHYDYGPTPFWFFHHWIQTDGFDKIVSESWKNIPSGGTNAMKSLMYKLKHLKHDIREWNKHNMIDSMELAQKAKIKWAIKGDENSKFFHGILNKKRNILNIRGIMVDGIWVDNPKSMKREFLDHFSKRFCKPDDMRATLIMEFPNRLHPDQSHDLEMSVSNEEIKKAVWDCGTDKAPGLDGFTFGFFRHFWHIVEKDVYNAVSYFFTHDDLPIGCNSSFIALIPKIPDANMVKDFRPVSLIGSVYKIIAKILSNRLVNVLGDILSEVPSAFIANRQILDGPFILNEVIQWCKAKKKQTLIFKVDFEKAYDSVRWDFLDDVLCKFGFGDKWRRWIQCCLQSSRGSIIINCSPTEEFEFGKGLKQCDPLSPFLFILIIESLHLSFQRVVEAGLFHGVKLHDTVLKLPFSYLGSMVGDRMHRLHSWDDTVDRVRNRLSKWKMKMLSSGGRLTLVKSVLGCMPIFHMSLFKVPAGILHKLESIRKHFFNGHEVSSRKISWVNWNKVITPKEKGGLGVSSLYALNRGLLFKWVWRFLTQGSSLWARVIKAIHGMDGSIGDIKIGNSKSCWSSIINEINVLSSKGIKLMNYLRITLGNGVFTRLWDEPWHVKGILKDSRLSLLKGRTVGHGRRMAQVMTGSLANRFDISRRGIVIDFILCGNCDIGVETTSHLFFTCDMATSVLRLINRWREVPDMEIDSYATWKGWFVTIRMASKNKLMFEVTLNMIARKNGEGEIALRTERTRLELDRFDGESFKCWQKEMQFPLTTLNVAYVLTKPYPEESENETLAESRECLKFGNDDFICRGHILNAMSDPLFSVYHNYPTARDL